MQDFSVLDILKVSGGRLANGDALGERQTKIRVTQIASLEQSGPGDCGFFFDRAFEKDLLSAKPGVLLTGEPFVKPLQDSGLPLWTNAAVIACADPYWSMAKLSQVFAKDRSTVVYGTETDVTRNEEQSKIDTRAVIDATAKVGQGVRIMANVVVEKDCRIGNRVVLYPGVFVGPGVEIGDDTVVFPNVTLYEWTKIGSRTRIHAGAVIGADGFGYAPRREGGLVVDHQKIYHLGRVVIGDDVEIGANACIDRGTFSDTRIGDKVKLDNLVQVGHNCQVSEGAVICGCAGLAGSAKVGRFAYIGGMAGIGNKVEVGDRGNVGACSLVPKDVVSGTAVIGNPARIYTEHFRLQAILNKILDEHQAKRSARRAQAGMKERPNARD